MKIGVIRRPKRLEQRASVGIGEFCVTCVSDLSTSLGDKCRVLNCISHCVVKLDRLILNDFDSVAEEAWYAGGFGVGCNNVQI